jgi:hypothetical protein
LGVANELMTCERTSRYSKLSSSGVLVLRLRRGMPKVRGGRLRDPIGRSSLLQGQWLICAARLGREQKCELLLVRHALPKRRHQAGSFCRTSGRRRRSAHHIGELLPLEHSLSRLGKSFPGFASKASSSTSLPDTVLLNGHSPGQHDHGLRSPGTQARHRCPPRS